MKKFVSGVIVGVLIMVTPQVYGAASSMIGKKIDKELSVKMDGKQVGTAVVTNGKSYLPVRDLADEMGLKIEVSKQEITLSSTKNQSEVKESEKQVEIKQLKEEKEQITKKLEQYNGHVGHVTESYHKMKKAHEDMVAQTSDPLYVDTTKVAYEDAKSSYEGLLQKIDECEKDLERINKRLKELGAE